MCRWVVFYSYPGVRHQLYNSEVKVKWYNNKNSSRKRNNKNKMVVNHSNHSDTSSGMKPSLSKAAVSQGLHKLATDLRKPQASHIMSHKSIFPIIFRIASDFCKQKQNEQRCKYDTDTEEEDVFPIMFVLRIVRCTFAIFWRSSGRWWKTRHILRVSGTNLQGIAESENSTRPHRFAIPFNLSGNTWIRYFSYII